MSKPETDWEAIEREYRAGVISVREIGRAFKVSDTAIRKRATADGWERDLTKKVKERTRSKVVRELGSQGGSHPQRVQTDAEIVENASETQVAIHRLHRADIASGRGLVSTLFRELAESTDNRHEIDEAIEEETAKDTNGKRAAMMRRAVALPNRAATLMSLSSALKNLIALERQAYNIDEGFGGEDPGAGNITAIEYVVVDPPSGTGR